MFFETKRGVFFLVIQNKQTGPFTQGTCALSLCVLFALGGLRARSVMMLSVILKRSCRFSQEIIISLVNTHEYLNKTPTLME